MCRIGLRPQSENDHYFQLPCLNQQAQKPYSVDTIATDVLALHKMDANASAVHLWIYNRTANFIVSNIIIKAIAQSLVIEVQTCSWARVTAAEILNYVIAEMIVAEVIERSVSSFLVMEAINNGLTEYIVSEVINSCLDVEDNDDKRNVSFKHYIECMWSDSPGRWLQSGSQDLPPGKSPISQKSPSSEDIS